MAKYLMQEHFAGTFDALYLGAYQINAFVFPVVDTLDGVIDLVWIEREF
jgi:hypothetical protein